MKLIAFIFCLCRFMIGFAIVGEINLWAELPSREWVRTFSENPSRTNNPAVVALTPAGEIVVSGTSQNVNNDFDYVILKYSQNGTRSWMKRFDSGGADQVRSASIDQTGAALITGTSKTIKVDSAGNITWTNALGGRDIQAHTNFIYVVGYSEVDNSVAKIGVDGITLWTRSYNGAANSEDITYQVTCDNLGNVYTAGRETSGCDPSTGCHQQVRLLSYNSQGSLVWSNTTGIRVLEKQDSIVSDLKRDGIGNIIVLYNENIFSFRWMRFTANGQIDLGTDGQGRQPEGFGFGQAIALDPSNNVYITGRLGEVNDKANTAFTTVKMSKDGALSWRRDFPQRPGVGRNEGMAVALDGVGNVYVAGSTTNAGNKQDIVVIKYDGAGRQIWVDTYDGSAHGNDVATSLCVDTNGSLYATGYSTTPQGGTEMITIKYSTKLKIEAKPTGAMHLEYFTSPGQQYALEITTNFFDWQSLITNTADANGLVQFDDTGGVTIPYQFYRGRTVQ